MAQLQLTGEYFIDITFQNMFHTYKARYSHHNMITGKGLEFLVKKWAKADSGEFKNIIVGTNSEEPTEEDMIDTFKDYSIFHVDISSRTNQLVLSNNNISGKHLNNTVEIGVIGIDGNGEQLLVSRDTHPPIDIPSSSIISLEYIYTLKSMTKN